MEISSNELPLKKTKRLTSVVWNHFERVRKADNICYAVCIHCNKKLSGSSNSGTTHLRNHLIRCLKRSNHDVTQILAAKRRRKDTTVSIASANPDEGAKIDEIITPVKIMFDQENNRKMKFDHDQKKEEIVNLGSIKFDQDRSRLDLARMIMLHGYPLNMVEHVGFKVFVKNLQPLFEVMTNGTLELDCMAIFAKEKQKVYEMIENFHGRVSLAADTWTSRENVEYLCLTANYIDEDWKLQKMMLNFVTLDASHTDDVLSDVVIKCLIDWNIDRKLFSMTFDDCCTYDEVVFKIKEWLSQNRPLLKNGQLFDTRSAAHIVRSVVQDALEAISDVTHKVRESVRYVKSSLATQGKFNELANHGQKHLILDCPVRWNSTYLMLETAAEYKGAFTLLEEQDASYMGALSEKEWEWAKVVASYIKLCVEYINVFTGNKTPTANIYFPEICDLHIHLIQWCKSEDEFISSMALKMKAKFDKYWSKCSLGLAIAAVLDPRFKMKLVEYYYSEIYGSIDALDHIKEISDGVRDLFNEYSLCSNAMDTGGSPAQHGDNCVPSTSNGTRDRLRGFDKYLHESSQSQSVTSDLEKYLEEPIFPRNYDFDILNWWKVHTPRYPILSMMARDILGIPVSTASPNLAFSTEGRVLDHHRASLNPETRQALICGQDWLRMELEEPSQSIIHYALPLHKEI